MGQGGGAIGESDGDGGSTLRPCDGPVDRDDDLGAGRHDLRDVGREVLDLLEQVVLLAHDLLARRCHAAGQQRPTPLILRYETDDYNCLHQDIYGELVFPLQVTVLLSRPRLDFTGGEFLLVEQRPRAQSRGEVVPLDQGEAVIFAVHHRPVPGKRGPSRVNLRHGVSRIRSGLRYSLGIIFHDAA